MWLLVRVSVMTLRRAPGSVHLGPVVKSSILSQLSIQLAEVTEVKGR